MTAFFRLPAFGATALIAAPFLFAAAPAAAQDDPGDKVNMVIVYGDDACPPSTGDVIVVCARKAESERYRIPENLRSIDNPTNVAWTQKVRSFETAGDFGTMSCSPVGAGGFTGCTKKLIDAAYAARHNTRNVKFGELIDEARSKRLSTIDEDAAAEQARVEQVEKQYMAKLKAEQEGPVEGTVDPSAPPVVNPNARAADTNPSKPGPFDDGADPTPRPVGPNVPAPIDNSTADGPG